jgi:hypothetical protein
MKIALCLHGYFNSFTDLTSKGEDGFEHLQKHVFSKGDVDVYFHSWDVENKNTILKLYGPYLKEWRIGPQKDFTQAVKENGLDKVHQEDGFRTPETILSHLWSVAESLNFVTLQREHYDVVISSRFDVGRINRNTTANGMAAPVQCINFDPTLPMGYLYMADWEYLESEGPADMWFYSGKYQMLKFKNIYDVIKRDLVPGGEYSEWAGTHSNGILNTIKAYKWFLIDQGMWYSKRLLETHWE